MTDSGEELRAHMDIRDFHEEEGSETDEVRATTGAVNNM
jgi:hypothetical protein